MITNKHKHRPICLLTTCQCILKGTPCTRIPGESLQAKLHTVHHQDTFSCIQRLRTESGRCIDGVMKKNIGNFAFNWRVIFVYDQITGQLFDIFHLKLINGVDLTQHLNLSRLFVVHICSVVHVQLENNASIIN